MNTIGVDFGTSGARAIALDASHQIIGAARETLTPGTTQPAQWQACLFRLLAALPLTVRQHCTAIAINGTSSTVLLCDGNGTPLTEALLYNNDCGQAALATLDRIFVGTAASPSQAIARSATSSLAKLLWWSQQPVFAAARYFLHQADWLAFLLHGQLGLSDEHNSLKLGYDVAARRYPDWWDAVTTLLRDRGNAQLQMPQVLPPGTPVGPVLPEVARSLQLPAQCQVCTGTTDSIAAFLASGATQTGDAVTSLGSTLVLKLLSDTPVNDAQYGIYSHRLGDRWLVGGASNTGGAVLQQFFSPTELRRLSAEIPAAQASPLDYYPLCQPGERFPINDPQYPPRLTPRPADPVAFLHGLLESMARIEASGYNLLQTLGASHLQRVYTAGGGAANLAWMQIRERLLQVPVARSQHTEAAYGTAKLAMSIASIHP